MIDVFMMSSQWDDCLRFYILSGQAPAVLKFGTKNAEGVIKSFLEKRHPNIEKDQNFKLSKISKMCQIASN
jgi:hypothetical protein